MKVETSAKLSNLSKFSQLVKWWIQEYKPKSTLLRGLIFCLCGAVLPFSNTS